MDGDMIYDPMYDSVYSHLSTGQSDVDQKNPYVILCQYLAFFTSPHRCDTTENLAIWDYRIQISDRHDSNTNSYSRYRITRTKIEITGIYDRGIVILSYQ